MTVLLIVLAVLVLAAFVLFGMPRRRGFGRRRAPRLGRGRISGRWGRRI
jgi:hypothetical protein